MTDSTQLTTALASQLCALERRVRLLQITLATAAFVAGAAGVTAFVRPGAPSANDVVTARRFVLVDSSGAAGATIELASLAVPGDANARGGLDRSLRIMVSDQRTPGTNEGSDSARSQRSPRSAELSLNPDRLSIALDTPDTLHRAHTSGMSIHAGPTLTLTRDGRSLYRLDPFSGGVRPVTRESRQVAVRP